MIKKGLYFHLRGKRVYRNYGFVLNVVFQLNYLLNESAKQLHGKALYLADHEPTELKAWADKIIAIFKGMPVSEYPVQLFLLLAKVRDILKAIAYTTPPMSSFRHK